MAIKPAEAAALVYHITRVESMPGKRGTGLFKSQKRAKQEANSRDRLGIEDTHLLGDIRDAHKIEHGQQKTVEKGQNARSISFAHLRVIFAQRHIAPPMQAVFNGPVRAHQLQQPLWGSELGREAGDAIDDLGARLAIFLHGTRQSKDLSNAGPLASQKVIEFAARHQFADFQASMALVDGACRAPVTTVGWRFAEKELQVVIQAGLIALDDEHIVPLPASHLPTEGTLRVQRIR